MPQYRVYITTTPTGQFRTPFWFAAMETHEARGGISTKESCVSKPHEQGFAYRKSESEPWRQWPEEN